MPSLLIGDPDTDTNISNVDSLYSLFDFGDVMIMRTSMSDLTGIGVGNHDLHIIGNPQLGTLAGLISGQDLVNFYCADNPILSSLGSQTFQSANFVQIVANPS